MVKKIFTAEAYQLPFFKQEGFMRKQCPKCGEYFWTQNQSQETCGESGSDECGCYSFLGNPATKRKFTLSEMREAFLSFFEKNGHTRIKPYPVVARWRKDIYLTHASIIDFQPYVTEGIAPPPANPLVISQPSIRLTDISNTGPTFGRHLTIFEMGGAHAFNTADREVYWKDDTVRFHQRFATEVLGIPSEEVIYKEGVWVGGGNAGPDVECIVRGLEVGTLVFMQYKVVGEEFVQLPIRTVDTGYGIDRFAWISQGVPSLFQAIYGGLHDKVLSMAGITNLDNEFLLRVAKYSGLVSVDKRANRMVARKRVSELTGIDLATLEKVLVPIENAWAVLDHTKTLSFMLSEGVVPSNIQEGYLARLLFRRVYRLMRSLNMSPDSLYDIIEMQADYWINDFPHLKELQGEIIEMLKVEEEKFKDTLQRGEGLVKRISVDLKARGENRLSEDKLAELYDSQGLPPEIVKQAAEKEGVEVGVPENFYALIANRHMQASKTVEETDVKFEEDLEKAAEQLPATEQLYYLDAYKKEFDAQVQKVIGGSYVVLNQTCFYPEGGGQPNDLGTLTAGGICYEVTDVQKIGKTIVHKLKTPIAFKEGTTVQGRLDWERRYQLMKSHTVTHLINGAARRVLGEHVWQSGTQKGLETSRLDISHYRRLSQEETHKIETLANQAIAANMKVETKWYPRNEAETLYGFRLYQGGAVPGKYIRVVKTGDWDVEACAGTHLGSTGEVGFVKIVYTERVQDGVERLGYAVGLKALAAMQQQETLLTKVSEVLNAPVDKIDKTAEKVVKELKEAQLEKRRLIKELAEKESTIATQPQATEATLEVEGVSIVKRDFGEVIDVNRMLTTATEVIKRNDAIVTVYYGSDGKTCRLLIMAGETAVKRGINACNIVKEAAPIFGGGGGGRPNFAQGGGTLCDKLKEAVTAAEEAIKKQLNH
ncbi:MAG: alanine--tRNA ligase [Nitrososphaerota archaeon]|jgi:alanyl-tRNA synthetase|uniref:alanine--tRNA ligase n=1 Tax=Candidatus Bathycorpusculum sp. TaxID=2994959 RepID=UPI0028203608|nr:alanine--tRNA ligase [Candidatus Termitimicrobium sp.]MCL2432606.1 alanine--tRNA ligase [Candidatus Termitimicrobium sp.]MDR0493160.1 alanine--tRNA ligase [Nitrososphaerota archaeon]